MANIPKLNSPHDDSALNILNTVIEKINKEGIDSVNEDVKVLLDKVLEIQTNIISEHNPFIIKPTFEPGGWWHPTGEKVTGENPYQVRNVTPYPVFSGMTISTKESDVYTYSLLRFKDGVSLNWISHLEFGTPYVFDDTYELRFAVTRKDRAPVTEEDLEEVSRLFGYIEFDFKSYIEDLIPVEDYIKFEPGGWWGSTGEKVTGENPYQIRNVTPYKSHQGMVLHPMGSGYNYRVLLFKDGVSLGWSELKIFGERYVFDDIYDVRIRVERLDQATVSQSDLNYVTEAFKKDAPILIPEKTIDKFNVIGDLEPVTTSPITNHFSNPNTITSQNVHDSIIQLVNNNDDCARYSLLGQDNYENNMYLYESIPNILKDGGTEWLRPPRGTDGKELKPPKIIITSGIHGKERNATYILYQFMRQLLENPDDNPVFDTLRNNIHFVFIPICSPSGFNDNSYENRANVNINRDFPPHGNVTQAETAHIKSVLDSNSDADYHIDFHNYAEHSYNNNLFGYSLTDDKDYAILTTNAYKYVGRKWQQTHSQLPQDRNYQWSYTANANVGTVGKYTTDVLGIPGTIIETPYWVTLMGETQSNIHGALVTQLGVDILSNLIIGIIDSRK